MKLQASELPFSKSQTRRKSPKLIPLIALTFLLTILPIYYPFYHKKLSLSSQIGYQHQENTTKSTSPLDPPPKPNSPTWRRSHLHGSDTSPAMPLQEKPIQNSPPVEKAITGLAAANRTVDKNPEPGESPGQAQTGSTISDNSTLEGNTRRPERNRSVIRSEESADNKCNLFNGEWIPNPEGPYYTNVTCSAIQEHQNCIKFGRPDTGYLKWRWKPDDCELPVFDPHMFLDMVRGKSMVFVGDSVARNHMQSLICLLSRVVQPLDASKPTDENRVYQYAHYNFNISIISSPYLIRTQKSDPNDFTRPYHLYLDEFDLTWTSKLEQFDYVIISAGQWFFRPSYFYLNRTLAGCLYCPDPNVTHLPSSFSYRWAFQTAFRAINAAAGFRGVAFARTFAPSHYEGGPWDKGGDCARRRPFRRNETSMEDYGLEMYRIQLDELRTAQEAGKGTGGKLLRLFDATKPMMLRPDGHPSKYGRWPGANQTIPNDCVHWCLPGPIDVWNDFLQELLKRELKGYYSDLERVL